MGKLCQFLTELSIQDKSIFSIPDDDLSNYQWIFANLFVCVEVLQPSQPNGVMWSTVSLPSHTFTGQA